MERAIGGAARCQVIRDVPAYEGAQGPMYAGGVSAERAGAQAIWLGMITMPTGSRTRAHLHQGHETAMYVIEGTCELWFGEDLGEHETVRAGDYLYIPANVPHVAVNTSEAAPLVVIAARTDPREQESVVLLPGLDDRVP